MFLSNSVDCLNLFPFFLPEFKFLSLNTTARTPLQCRTIYSKLPLTFPPVLLSFHSLSLLPIIPLLPSLTVSLDPHRLINPAWTQAALLRSLLPDLLCCLASAFQTLLLLHTLCFLVSLLLCPKILPCSSVPRSPQNIFRHFELLFDGIVHMPCPLCSAVWFQYRSSTQTPEISPNVCQCLHF